MIFINSDSYAVMIHNKAILDFPIYRKVRIDIPNNWLYQAGAPSPSNSSEEEGELDFTN